MVDPDDDPGNPAGTGDRLYTHGRPSAGRSYRRRLVGAAGHASRPPGPRGPGDADEDAPAEGAAASEVNGEVPDPELADPQVPMDANLPRTPPAPPRTGAVTAREPDAGRHVSRPAAAASFARSVRSLEPISDAEASAFAARFALDFQSFDETRPSRRAEVLRSLLADPQAATWGWSGSGRQRADAPLPGRTFRSSELVVFVEVVLRVTAYIHTGPAAEAEAGPVPGAAELDGRSLVGPSSAPPEGDPAWTAGPAQWIRMTVPVTRHPDDGRLVVDPHLVPESTS